MFQMEQKSCKLQHHWLRLVLFGPVVCVKKIEMWKVYGWRGMQSDDNAQHRFLVKVNLSIHSFLIARNYMTCAHYWRPHCDWQRIAITLSFFSFWCLPQFSMDFFHVYLNLHPFFLKSLYWLFKLWEFVPSYFFFFAYFFPFPCNLTNLTWKEGALTFGTLP